ncbi:MAG: hypothetical protein Q8930_04675 [Bacillota bacterium]|nr:hypothetical protein [Bacillota bacterium]
MFINELNKKEAIAFLGLVKSLTVVDSVFAYEEDKLIEEYIEELGLNEEIIRFMSLGEALSALSPSEKRIQNIVYFELLGLALVDGDFAEGEIDILNKIADKFAISKEKQDNYLKFFKDVKILYDSEDTDIEKKIESLRCKAEDLLA